MGTRWGLLLAATGVAWIAAAEPGPGALAPMPDGLLAQPGAALRRAAAAGQAGRTDEAERLLAAVASRHPVIADHADLLRVRLLVEAGRLDEAIAMQGRWEHTDSPLVADFHEQVGLAYAARGDEIAARSAWEFARLDTEDPDRLARLHVRSARSYERSGEPATAAESYLRVWTFYPLSDEAGDATERLQAIERDLGRALRTGLAWRKRGDALFRQRRNEEALEAYDHALASGELTPAQSRRARRQRAETLFRLRRYPEAAEAFGALPRDDETAIARARSLARAGRVQDGASELEKIGKASRSTQGARATFLAALLVEGEDEPARARKLYTEVIRRAPRSSYAREALWRLGWADYRAGRLREAAGYLEKLEALEVDPISALRARYWTLRARERAGQDVAAGYAALAREFPLSYYGWRARARAAVDGEPAGRVELVAGRDVLASRDLERPRILLEAGLEEAAREELDRLFVRARGLDDRLALAQLYSNAGDFHRSQRLIVDAYVESLARGPDPHRLEVWWHAFPAPFGEEVRSATAPHAGLEPALVYAIMREESGYRPEVVSVSGARGLLQLMPSTAERVAPLVNLPAFEADDLFVPQVNIRIGSAYLGQLLDRFDGRRDAAIGSYNAGPQAVARWLRTGPSEEDEWVEAIAYDQTRGYVKRVLRSLHAYRVLY